MRRAAAFAILALVAAAAGPTQTVRAGADIEVGVLRCEVEGGTGFVFGSSKELACVFKSGDYREEYVGTIEKVGVDIGRTRRGVLAWAVFAPTRHVGQGALAGRFAGVTGEATVGVGVGANALLGGSRRSIALQPLSVGTQRGLNLAIGIAALSLRPLY